MRKLFILLASVATVGVASISFADTPRNGTAGDPAPKPTASHSAAPPASTPPPAPAATPAATQTSANAPIPSGRYVLSVSLTKVNGVTKPAQTNTYDVTVVTNGNTSTLSTPVDPGSPSVGGSATGTFTQGAFAATYTGDHVVTLNGAVQATTVPTIAGTYSSVKDQKSTGGTFVLALNLAPIAHKAKDLKVYGATAKPAGGGGGLWERFSAWCKSFEL